MKYKLKTSATPKYKSPLGKRRKSRSLGKGPVSAKESDWIKTK